MWWRSALAFMLGFGGVATAQQGPAGFGGERMVSLTAGVGNAMGWLGAQGERYFLDERLSIYAGLGYTPSLDPGDPRGPTFALGFRGYTTGAKHRLFFEGSASQVMVTSAGADGGERIYGPGLQVGYQFVKNLECFSGINQERMMEFFIDALLLRSAPLHHVTSGE